MVNDGDTVAPLGILTEAGTLATAVLLLASVTMAPVPGAGPLIVTVFKVVELPPTIALGDKVTAETPGGISVRVALAVTPL
jgi:hypothetical protein